MKDKALIVSDDSVKSLIRVVRNQRVMLDADLAQIYGVPTARLNQQAKRNKERFPDDFVFQITPKELAGLMLQTATSNPGRGGRRKLPCAFTEHGAIMAANVLSSRGAVQMSIFVVRAFLKMRETFAQSKELAAKLAELEHRLTQRLDVHEKAIVHVLTEIRKLMEPPPAANSQRRQIGFHVRDEAGLSGRPRARGRKSLESDSLYKAPAVGRSKHEQFAATHDAVLYPK